MAPRLVQFVEAPYPEEAERARLEASIRLRLTLDAQGAVTTVDILEGAGHGFDEAARDAALRFRFDPAVRDGVPVPSRIAYLYEFRLPAAPEPAAAPRTEVALASSPQELRPTPTSPGTGPEEGASTGSATEGPRPTLSSASADGEVAPSAVATTSQGPVDAHLDAIDVTVEGESVVNRRRGSAEAVRVIETETVRREAADMGLVLSRTEGVGVRRAGGLGSRSRFSLAGLSNDQIRFFIDGVPLELAGYGPDFANVPVNLAQRMEVFQGVVPVRFGADALGGAVQIVTTENLRASALSASYELGSFETHRVTASAQRYTEATGLLLRGSAFFDSSPNDYAVDVTVEDDLGRVLPARLPRFHDAFRAGGGGLEVGYADRPWARRFILRAFASASTQEIQHDATMTSAYGEVDSANVSGGATLRFEQTYGERLVVDAVGGYVYRRSRLTDLGRCAYDWFGRCVVELPQPGELEDRAIDRRVGQHTGFARINLGWSLARDQGLRLALAPTWVGREGEDRALIGASVVDPLTGKRSIFNLVTGVEYEFDALDERLENIAFAKNYLQLARAERLLPDNTFTPANRDSVRFGVGDSLRYRVNGWLMAKAAYEWATRLPRPDELFGDGILIDTNLDLKPEASHNLNLEVALDAGQTRLGGFRGSVMGFTRLADQLILLVGREGYFTYKNVYAARSLGVMGAAGWTSPGQFLSLDGNVTWQDFRNTSSEGTFGTFDGQRIPNQPSLLANGSARVQLTGLATSRDELSLTWHARYTHAFFRGWEKLGASGSKQELPSQLIHSLALTYVTRPASATLSWTVDVQNLTDADAFDFYGVQRPGRSVFAKVVAEL
ncbi:TonB-dependent siderophore myxochelin receptor MxcH [Myxococcus sp. K15C18031901]|uniref:TonB-dependent siderophore myxochelin receptor MxcH n=1 Tax=Myxococcus dinghuensis TaxID=2906761 RepID=UPI0020A7D862|nr:TonB-dependent siderophore myxochelin receptor MxcH [Myxococcus dinghuensis]MCP3099472.1 TonB-dependent siderophore myxochelin receptor MxcH [Myxococcus dinghuensis]